MTKYHTLELGKGDVAVGVSKMETGALGITLEGLREAIEPGLPIDQGIIGVPLLVITFTDRDSVDVVINALRTIRGRIVSFTTA
jgi:hypothetical protein